MPISQKSGMSIFIRFFSIATLMVSLLSCNPNKETNGEQADMGLSVDVAKIDLHDILQYREKSHVFKIKNTSKNTLTISGVEKSCGCTKVELEKDILLPGEETNLMAILSAQDREGDFFSHITVKWNYEKTKETHELKLSLRGKAVRLIICDPPNIEFGEIDIEKSTAPITKQIVIHRGDAKITWNELEIPGGDLTILDQNTFLVRYTLDPNKHPIGTFRDELNIQVKNSGTLVNGEHSIPILAKIKSEIKIKPESIYLGSLEKETVKKGVIKISSPSNKSISVLSISISKHIQTQIENSSDGSLVISYLFNSGKKTGNISEKQIIRIFYNGNQFDLSIPYIGYVQ